MPKKLFSIKIFCLIFAIPSICFAFFGRVEFNLGDDFTENSVRRGIKAEKGTCEKLNPGAMWAQVTPEIGECIKYWSAGLTAATDRTIVFFHGDVEASGPLTDHTKLSGERLSSLAQSWSRHLKAPYIYIGRPGTHGSSGEHSRRRMLEEAEVLSKVLNGLRERYGIREFIVAGQSGGGHVTASLLTLREDIVCAVPTSSPSSPRVRYLKMGRLRDITNYESYEPTEHLKDNLVHPKLRVFILGDPRDSNVFWESQIVLAPALKLRGIEHAILEGEATGQTHHGLSNSARYIAGLCYHNKSSDEIKNYLVERKIKG